jgi:hypothetical protein
VRRAALVALASLAFTAAAAAAPPRAGVVVPGRSLGGVSLGATEAQVRARWGRDHGVCLCPGTIWYYNYAAFQPQGVGVTFRGGRAVALYTLWSPPGWHTSSGLNVGDEAFRVKDTYGILLRTQCRNYAALSLVAPNGTRTSFYLQNGRIWGLGLTARGTPVCRDARPA